MTLLAILTAVFNTLWQATALAALVWLALKLIRTNAATRCVIWWIVLTALILLPVVPRPTAFWDHRQVFTASQVHAESDHRPVESVFTELPAIVTVPEKPAEKWPLAIFALWAAVLIFRLSRISQSYLYLTRVKRNSNMSELPLPETGRNTRVLLSRDIASPMAVGFLHAAIVIPADLIERVTPAELDQILLHESAHLARRDDWWNLLARLLGAILALHPIAWWILRQIEHEREAACDDWVVARTGAVRPYAETLAHMAELRWQSAGSYRAGEALASGVFGRGSRIGSRIEELLEAGRQFSACVSAKRVVAICVALGGLTVAGTFAPRWVAFAKTPLLEKAVTATVAPPAPVPAPRPVLVAQVAPKAAAPRPAPLDKSDLHKFEVASIRPATFPSPEYEAGFYQASASSGNKLCGARFSISGTLFSIPRASVCQLIALAYGVRGYQIVGAPALPQVSGGQGAPGLVQAAIGVVEKNPSFFYDIKARAPGNEAPTEDAVQAMLRDLLADRFRLRVHRDTKEMSYFALVVGKNGTGLQPTRANCQPKNSVVHGDVGKTSSAVHSCNQSMEQLVRAISSRTDKPVVDKTGLTGNFDYDLNVDFSSGDDLNSIYLDAYRNQLGLVLESQKGPVDVLMVDHVEAPSAN